MVYNSNIIAEYPALAARSAATMNSNDAILNWTLGIVGEAGELCQLATRATWLDYLPEDDVHGLFIGELGDLCYYVTSYLRDTGGDFEGYVQFTLWDQADALEGSRSLDAELLIVMLAAAGIAESIKKLQSKVATAHLAWKPRNWLTRLLDHLLNRPVPLEPTLANTWHDQGLEQISTIVVQIARLCDRFDTTLAAVLSTNIAKLEARHPDGFNSDYVKEVSS